jgi:hypothetical protein
LLLELDRRKRQQQLFTGAVPDVSVSPAAAAAQVEAEGRLWRALELSRAGTADGVPAEQRDDVSRGSKLVATEGKAAELEARGDHARRPIPK